MSKTIVERTPAEKTAHAALSRYATPVLLRKLEASAFSGTQKKVVIEILEKRETPDVAKYKGDTWVKPGGPADSSKSIATKTPVIAKGLKKTNTTKADSDAQPITKVKKEIVDKKVPRVKELIDETSDNVIAILGDESISKTEKIKALFGLGYTASQISKSSLNAHPSFCHTVKKALEAEQEAAAK